MVIGMPFKRIVEERMRKGPILKRLREQFIRASTKILDLADFESCLKSDIVSAKNSVLIPSPFLSKPQVSKFLSFKEVEEAISKGVKFIVITRPLDKIEVGGEQEYKNCM